MLEGIALAQPKRAVFLDHYDTAIFWFSKGLPFSSTIPFVPAKEAKNTPTLSMR
jgi:hypothetical protein